MDKNEAEKVIRETIEYANNEIAKNKKKTRRGVIITFCSLIAVIIAYLAVFKLEMPVKYRDNIVSVNVSDDSGLDINVNLKNYKSANGILVENSEGNYDLYLGLTQTLYTKMSDGDTNLVRAGNGIIVDYNSDKVIQFIPGEINEENIKNIYYVDDLNEKVMCMENSELINYEKTLVWTR